ncbi:hypothetical protein OnM2_052087 [Erysiphe neolycopersici]|uniref:Polyprotein n=1 Tax=Erysiphe neolycopersici TaxID=212602 RepID=A0A420HS40_9PEZI|nr:hypothetical protein OnM2_052087 [Erysiphe neolycopersici]
MYLLTEALSFDEMINRVRAHFETAERQSLMLSKWKNFSPTISTLDCFNILVKDIRKTQLGLPFRYRGDESLRDAVVDAVRDVPECSFACYKPAARFEALCADIRASIATKDNAFESFRERLKIKNKPYDNQTIRHYIVECEGEHDVEDEDGDIWDTLIMDVNINDKDEEDQNFDFMDSQFVTTYGTINGYDTVSLLNDQSARHALANIDSSSENISLQLENELENLPSCEPPSIFWTTSRYSDSKFQGILIDTGAAQVSTAGQDQFCTLCKTFNLSLDTSHAGHANICFGIGKAVSIGCALVETPIGKIKFHIMPSDIPFLTCLKDMDNLKVSFDNFKNILIQGNKIVPIIRKWGHPWLLLHNPEKAITHNFTNIIAQCHLTQWRMCR